MAVPAKGTDLTISFPTLATFSKILAAKLAWPIREAPYSDVPPCIASSEALTIPVPRDLYT